MDFIWKWTTKDEFESKIGLFPTSCDEIEVKICEIEWKKFENEWENLYM